MTRSRPGFVMLRPAPGRRVSHRDGRLFAAGGESVDPNPFYQRLIAAGDLVAAPSPAKIRTPRNRRNLPEGTTP